LKLSTNGYVKKNNNRVFYEKRVESPKANFKQMFKGNSSLNNASLYLNTQLVTASLIASQLRANDIRPYALLSTQVNYNPLLLTLTQYEEAYIETWVNEYKYDLSIIEIALKRTTLRSTPSFEYINNVIIFITCT
jgi:hypothetical protein